MNFDTKLQADYVRQLEGMWQNGKAWRKAHPDTEALISWNIPPGMMLVSPISEAVRMGFVRTNPAGLELLKALWAWDDHTEPTVLMCRVVLEREEETKRLCTRLR